MRFVPEFLSFAEHIEICVPVHDQGPATGYSIQGDRLSYRALPPSRTLEEFVRRLPQDGLTIVEQLYRGMRTADLIWINGPHPLLPLAVLLASALRKPHMLWLRGDILGVVRSKYLGNGLRNRIALRTGYFLDQLIRLSAHRRVVFYTGESLTRYAEGARYAQAASSSLVRADQLASAARSTAHSPVRLLWAGQLRPVKGLVYLLRAVRVLLDRETEVHLTIVGDGEQREVLEQERRRLGLEAQVSLVGYKPPGPVLDRYFDESDVYVLPSLSEGVPKVLYEAMARGLPVVATEVGGVPQVICHGRNGLLVPARDANNLADAIARVCSDSEMRERFSREALETARNHTAAAETERISLGLSTAFPDLWRHGR